MLRETGIGVVAPKTMAGRFTALFAETLKNADSPKMVTPFWTQLARALTGPKLAGMFGSTHDPSWLTCTLRFSTLTVQFSFNCALAATQTAKPSAATLSTRCRTISRAPPFPSLLQDGLSGCSV